MMSDTSPIPIFSRVVELGSLTIDSAKEWYANNHVDAVDGSTIYDWDYEVVVGGAIMVYADGDHYNILFVHIK